MKHSITKILSIVLKLWKVHKKSIFKAPSSRRLFNFKTIIVPNKLSVYIPVNCSFFALTSWKCFPSQKGPTQLHVSLNLIKLSLITTELFFSCCKLALIVQLVIVQFFVCVCKSACSITLLLDFYTRGGDTFNFCSEEERKAGHHQRRNGCKTHGSEEWNGGHLGMKERNAKKKGREDKGRKDERGCRTKNENTMG